MLTVPAPIYLLGFGPVAATTASLVIVAATSVSSLLAHARDGDAHWRAGLLFAAACSQPRASAPPCSAAASRSPP